MHVKLLLGIIVDRGPEGEPNSELLLSCSVVYDEPSRAKVLGFVLCPVSIKQVALGRTTILALLY